jgi:GNAT superfamily N-acetyltransferase
VKTAARKPTLSGLTFQPLTPGRWPDLEELFGERGACGGCWCMWWRLPRSQFNRQRGTGNKRALKRIVQSGPPPGLLAYEKGEPVGWCALGPRASYSALERARTLKPVDDRPVWSVVCFFVTRGFRGAGLSVKLLKAAAAYARRRGARILEGYPVDTRKGRWADPFVYTGTVSAFRRAGFHEVARRSPTRPLMRRFL